MMQIGTSRALMVATLLAACAWYGAVDAEEGAQLSTIIAPEVRLVIEERGRNYDFTVTADNPYAKLSGRIAIGGASVARRELDRFPARVSVPKDQLIDGRVRFGLELSWFNADGSLRQREVLVSPAHAGLLPSDDADLRYFDVAGYFERIEREKLRITIPVTLSEPSKVTIAINDANGRRLRNLVSGIAYEAGKQLIEWDGRTDYGATVAPGTYRYKLMTHPGLSHDLKMQFSNGGEDMLTPYGPNHSQFHNLCANESYVFAAAPNTEGGNAIIAMTPDGAFAHEYHKHLGTGMTRAYPVADAERLYVLNDGVSWGGSRAKTWITISAYEVETGRAIQLKSAIERDGRNIRFNSVSDSSMPEVDGVRRAALQGAALIDGIIYFSHLGQEEILMYDTASDELTGSIPLAQPGRLAAHGGKLYAISGRDVVEVDAEAKRAETLFSVDFAPTGLTTDGRTFYLLGKADSTISVFDQRGKAGRPLGVPGGAYTGAWQPERLVNPNGLALAADGHLWVAEKRKDPKRLTRWDTRTRKIVYEKYGPPSYGSPSAGFDGRDSSRWIADGCLWAIDERAGTAQVVSILLGGKGHLGEIGRQKNYRFLHRDGRTFVIGQGLVSVISELLPDNTLKDLACITNVNIFDYQTGRRGVEPFLEALAAAYPDQELEKVRYQQKALMIWVDQDGDGSLDADEFQFSDLSANVTTGYWGISIEDLEFQLCHRNAEGKLSILTFAGDRFNACGAPDYSIERALASAAPMTDPLIPGVGLPPSDNSYSDHLGNVVLNHNPYMYSFNKRGGLNWSFPNRWSNVHGSQKAPLPSAGEIQGQLFTLGTPPLGEDRSVMALQNNHGRIFFMTSDGLYVDELFKDCRVSSTRDEDYIGGEPFGGTFGYDAAKDRYILQGGTSGYRIYEVNGLDRLRESEGSISVTLEQLEAAAKLNPIEDASSGPKEMTIAHLGGGASLRSIGGGPNVAEWQGPASPIGFKAGYDDRRLYLSFKVMDPSPWVNNGTDVSALFKTGDGVDIQLATADSAQDPQRRNAAEGDVRIFIAPFDGGSAAVRYRYVATGAGLNPMEFNSPWRSYTVADVTVLDDVEIEASPSGMEYTVKVAIPLADLGLAPGGLNGRSLRGDVGVIFGDDQGTVNLARLYWANKETGLVNDVPGEMMPQPQNWGTLSFGGAE